MDNLRRKTTIQRENTEKSGMKIKELKEKGGRNRNQDWQRYSIKAKNLQGKDEIIRKLFGRLTAIYHAASLK